MMIDKGKKLLTPYNKGFKTHLGSIHNTSFALVGTGGPAPCRAGVPRPMSFYESNLFDSVSFNIYKWSSTFCHSKYTSNQFVSYYIDNSHFRFSFSLPSDVVIMQLRIKMSSSYSRQMQQLFDLLIGYRTDF